jgi:hypothetical protein
MKIDGGIWRFIRVAMGGPTFLQTIEFTAFARSLLANSLD